MTGIGRAGEHGTGRNVAPFVEMEWGSKAYELMWDLKQIFDPDFVLNPGVLLNRDPDAHRKFFKPSPTASPIVDRCIECGFCESNCPSRDITLTPRQRIATYKEITRLRGLGDGADAAAKERLVVFEKAFDYDGDATCAADGMCQQKCPVKINTGARCCRCCMLCCVLWRLPKRRCGCAKRMYMSTDCCMVEQPIKHRTNQQSLVAGLRSACDGVAFICR